MELGAGDGDKVKFLIEQAVKEGYDFEYIPIDISHSSNLILAEVVKKISPDIKMTVLTALYEQGIKWVHENKEGRNVFVSIGNSMSNLTTGERKEFLQYLKNHMKKGDMLMWGLDYKKNPEIIRQAYSCPK